MNYPGGSAPFPYGGGGDSLESASRFLGRRSVRDTWIALWVLWLLWALLFMAKQTLGSTRFIDASRDERISSAVGPEEGPYGASPGVTPIPGEDGLPAVGGSTTGGVVAEPEVGSRGLRSRHDGVYERKSFFGRTLDNLRDRIDRTHDLIRDLTLMLLLVVTINTFGRGSGIAVLVLAWIYMATAFLWAGVMVLVESRVVDILLGSFEMLVLLAMLIAAYAMGWDIWSE